MWLTIERGEIVERNNMKPDSRKQEGHLLVELRKRWIKNGTVNKNEWIDFRKNYDGSTLSNKKRCDGDREFWNFGASAPKKVKKNVTNIERSN